MINQFKAICCLVAAIAIIKQSKADTYGNIIVSNCYQSVSIENSSTIHQVNFLKSNGAHTPNKIHVSFSNLTDIDSIYIYNVIHHPFSPNTYSMLTKYKYTEQDIISPSDSIRISPILKDTVFATVTPLDVAFVDPVFVTTDRVKPCLPFSGFKLNFFCNLSNLCGYKLYLKLPPGSPPPTSPNYNNIGLYPISTWQMEIHDNGGVLPETIPINSDFCDTSLIPHSDIATLMNTNHCFTFDLEIKIEPCPNREGDPDCPTLTYVQPITFCCWCERKVW